MDSTNKNCSLIQICRSAQAISVVFPIDNMLDIQWDYFLHTNTQSVQPIINQKPILCVYEDAFIMDAFH